MAMQPDFPHLVRKQKLFFRTNSIKVRLLFKQIQFIISVLKFFVPVSVCPWSILSILCGALQQKEFGVVSVIYLPFIGTSQKGH